MSSNIAGGHVLVVPLPAWGHMQPLATYAIKLVQLQANLPREQQSLITFFTVGDFITRVQDEIGQCIKEAPEYKDDLLNRIRVVSIGGKGRELPTVIPILWGQFPGVYDTLLADKTITCAATGTVYTDVPKPSAVIVDHICCPVIKAIVPKDPSVPILAWLGHTACCILFWFGPEEHGGQRDVRTRVLDQLKDGNKSPTEMRDIYEAAWRPALGSLIHIPGLQPFYDYETVPQEPSIHSPSGSSMAPNFESIALTAGVVVNSSSSYEPAAMPVLRSWLDSIGKAVYDAGPLVPSGYSVTSPAPDRDNEVMRFLDSSLKTHGERSVLYISFGSMFWPSKSEYVWAWLELLLELGVPFIMSTATMASSMPESLVSNINKSDYALLTGWAPQAAVLNHKATGWFMSHVGHNSATEAMAAGVPMIGWPIIADHPFMAAYQSLTVDAAFELVQTRTGARGLRPLYRGKLEQPAGTTFVQPQGTVEAVIEEARDIMRRAQGEEGKRIRKNAEALKDMMVGLWEEDGVARKRVLEFSARFGGRK